MISELELERICGDDLACRMRLQAMCKDGCSELTSVDATRIDLVGSPAIGRKFLLFKSSDYNKRKVVRNNMSVDLSAILKNAGVDSATKEAIENEFDYLAESDIEKADLGGGAFEAHEGRKIMNPNIVSELRYWASKLTDRNLQQRILKLLEDAYPVPVKKSAEDAIDLIEDYANVIRDNNPGMTIEAARSRAWIEHPALRDAARQA